MAATEVVPIRPLGVADLEAAQNLSLEAGWNQVESDWRIFLELGHLFGIDGPDGALRATGATLPLGHEFGWISMIIVTAAVRQRGIAAQLVLHGLEDLASQGLVPGLDATPAGRAVYARLGFRDTWPVTRLVRPGTGRVRGVPDPIAPELRAATVSDLEAIAALDHRAFEAERRAVLARLIERAPQLAVVGWTPGAAGFLLGRFGRTSTHLGPVVASEPSVALSMIDHALGRAPGPIVIDLVDLRPGLRAALEERGFAPQRTFSRMFYRRAEPFGDPNFAIAIAGPELG
jgi:ribosomal protein S18 acetylase RimI-like enzyme